MTLKLTAKDKKQMRAWVDALRSGKYKQTTGGLQDCMGFCCLGVACDMFIPKDEIIRENGFVTGDMPEYQPYSPAWLIKLNADFKAKVNSDYIKPKYGFKCPIDIPRLNDSMKWSFDQIANAIEATYLVKANKKAFELLVDAHMDKMEAVSE